MQTTDRTHRSPGPRTTGTRRFLMLQGLLLLGLAVTGASRAAAAENPWSLANRFGAPAIPGLTMRLVSDTLLVLDSNFPGRDGPDAGFHAVRIVNTGGTTVEGARARLDMAGTGFSLAGAPVVQRASQYVGRLSPGDSVTVFWYIGWPRTIGSTGTATVTLTDNSMATLTRTDRLVTYSSISSGTGGQIYSLGISSSDAVGALISTEVTYEYGTTSVGDHFQLQPAGNRDFNAGCFQLVRAQVLSSTVVALPAGLTNTLWATAVVSQSGANKRATVKYTYRSICVGQSTFADPYATQTSGNTNYKYSSNFGLRYSTQPYFPPGTNLFTITKVAPDTTARVNDPVRFDVIINNPYGIEVVVDSIVDVMPAGAIFDSVSSTSDVTVARSSRNPLPGDVGTIVFVGEPDVSYAIPANGSIRLSYWVRLTGPLGTYTNQARAFTNQIQLGNTFASATVRTVPADISVSKTLLGPARPMARDTLVYTILTRNATAQTLAVTLTDSLPAGTTLLSATRSGSASGRLVSWPAFNLPGDTDRIDTVRVYAPDAGDLTNVARIAVVLENDDLSNNRSAITTTLVPAEANLAVTKSRIGPASPLAGDTLVYTVTTTNAGPKVANGVLVTDSIPAGLTYLSASGSPMVTGRQVVWGPITLAVGGTRTDTLRVVAPLEGTYANVARVAGTEVDPDPTNNRVVEDPGTVVGPRANLAIAKTRLGTGPVAIGDAVTYLLTVTNTGPSAATGVSLVDSLPSGLTFSSASRGPTVSGRRVEWAPYTLASGQARIDTLVVIGAVGGSYGNIARVSGTETDPDLSDNRVVHAPAVDVLAVDIAVSKVRVGSGEATVGQVLTWTLTVENLGLVTASGVMLKDSLPTGYEYVSATGSPAVSGRVVTWGPLTLAAAASQSYTIEARAIVAGVWSNVLVGTSTQPDGNTANNRATDAPPITVNPASGLAVSKLRTTAGPFYVGDAITYTISVQNGGPDGATNVILADSLPTGFTFQSATGSPTVTGQRIVWPAFTLAANVTATRSITVIGSTPGTWSNVALVAADQVDSDLSDNRYAETPGTTVFAEADLSIVKTRLTAGPFLVGDTIAYRIVTTNGGPSAATGVTVRDTLPSGFAYRSATGSPVVTGQEVRWTFTLGAGLTRTDTVVVNTADAGSYANAASVSGDQADRDLSDNRSVETPSTVVSPSADLSLTKVRLGAGPFYVGDTLSYVLTSLNSGPSPATGVTITDVLPAGYTYLSASHAPSVSGQTVTWGPFALAIAGTRTDTLRVVVTAPGSYVNTAVIAGTETDRDPADNTATEAPGTTVSAKADLSVLKTRVTAGPFFLNDIIEYSIAVQNAGPSAATGVRITDTLPTGYTFVSATNTPTVTGQLVVWGPFTLASGASRTETLRVRATAAGTYRNTADVAGTEFDPDTGDNRSTETPGTTVDLRAELSITKTRLGAGPFYVGQNISYAIRVDNAGPSGTTGLVVTDTLPVGYTFVSATGSPTVTGRVVRWGPVSLAAGAFRTDTLVVQPTVAGTFVNAASAAAPEDDLDPTDNRDEENAPGTSVLPRADVSMTKTRLGAGPFFVSDTLTYVLRTDNAGPSPATGITVADTLPTGYAFVSSTGSPTVAGQVLTFGPFNLAIGGFRSDTLRVRMTAAGSYTNAATATGSENDQNPTNNRGAESPGTTVALLTNLVSQTVVVGPPAPRVGDEIILVIRTRNEGPSNASGVVVTDSLPAGVTLVRATGGAAVSGRQLQWGPFLLGSAAVRIDTIVVRAEAEGSQTNVSRAVGTEVERSLADNRGSASFFVGAASADLVVTKRRLTTAQLYQGDEALYEISVRNAGPASEVTGVTLVDSLPSGMAYVSATGSPVVSGQAITWGPFTLANGAERTETVRVRLLALGTYANLAVTRGDLPDPDTTNNRVTDPNPPTVLPRANLSVRKQVVGRDIVAVGEQVTFTITTLNPGPSRATGVTVVDSLPQGMTLVRASGAPVISGGVLRWGPFTLDSGVTRVDTVVVAITAAGRLVNVARASGTESDASDDDNRSGAVVVAEEARADLSITKVRVRPAAPVVGDTLVYVLTTRNAGPSPATGVVVTDSLPAVMRFLGGSRGATAVGQVVTWPPTTLPRNGVLVDTVRAVVQQAGEFRNKAMVRGAERDPDQDDNSGYEDNPTAPLADLRVTKALVSPLQPVVGDTMLFVLSITNAGPSNVVAARLTDSLPSGFQLVRTSRAPLVQGRAILWSPIDLPAGASRADSVWVSATEVGSWANVALAAGGEGPNGPIADPDPSSNRAVVQGTVGPTPRLFLSKRASGEAQRGAALAFDLLLRNDGPGLITDSLFLVDTLPQALVYQGASAPGWAVQFANGIVSARRAGPLAERDSLRIRLFTRVADNAPTQFENTATAGVIPSGIEATARATAGRGIRPVRATTGVITLVSPDGIDLVVTADRAEAEVLETVNYSARLVAVRAVPDPTLRLGITLPPGFTLTPGTVRVVGADPARIRTTDTSIQLPLSGLLAGTPVVVAYQARPGTEALRSRGITNAVLSNPESPELVRDSVRTLVRAAMGEDEATIVGQVTMTCTNERSGVPGIRLVLQDGREVRTDADGRYSFPGIAARPHVLRVDEASLPAGVRLVLPRQAVAGREGGAAVLVRPMYGELVAADFTLEPVDGGSCATAMAAEAGAAVAVDSSARRPGLLLSAMVQARVEAYDRADSLGRVDANVLDMNIKELATWNADSTRRGAVRGALYLEGSMGEGRNVTLRVDTERPHLDRFFNDLRPDELYPLLGDAAASAARAQARGRVFGEVNYDGATARFGDFLVPTPEGGTVQLGRYPRVLSGAMASTQGAKGMATGWASRTTSRFMVDEFRGDESTGLLQLRRPNAVLWSETVELVTFDRAHPGVVLGTERLQRFVDYSVEPGTGRLVLRRLVPGYDEAMNPIVIRVAYEVDGEGEHGWVYGGSGELRFGESARAGVLVVRDDDPLQRFQMASIGGSATLAPGVTLGAELATSDLDGVTGMAGRVDLQVATGAFRLTGRYQDVGADFRNPAAGILPDRREAALLGSYQLDALTSVGGEYYRSALRSGRDAREGGQVWVARKFGEKADLELGLRRILAGGVAGDSTNSAATTQDGTTARFRLRYALDRQRDAAFTGEVEAGLGGDMPSRGAFGFGMRVFEQTRLYVGQEINTGTGGGYDIASGSRRDQTVIGFQSEYRPGQQVFSEYRIGRGIDGRTAASVVGLRNTWKLNEQLAFTGLAERQATATGTGYAIGGGAEFRRPDATDASVRAEYRVTPAGADNVFATAGVIQRVGAWASLLAQTSVGWQPEADLVSARSRAGMVFRRGESTSMLVARYEHHFERSQGALAGERLERTVHLLSAHGTVPMGQAMRFRGQLATKFVEDAVGGSAVDAQATLLGLRLTRDLGRRWDASLAVRLLGDGTLSNGLTSYGLEAGYEVVAGIRAAAGYNVRGFKDRDLAPGATTQRGFYLDLILTATEALLGSRP